MHDHVQHGLQEDGAGGQASLLFAILYWCTAWGAGTKETQ